MKEGDRTVTRKEFNSYNDCWKLLADFVHKMKFNTDRFTEIICYGIATVGFMGGTIHHCGTFLRQMMNKKPVILYLDAAQTQALRVYGSSDHFEWKSFKELF